MISPQQLAHFRTYGFVVLPAAFDPLPLSNEIDRSLRDGCRSLAESSVGGGGIGFQYVPMTCERTPTSLSLLDYFVAPATELMGVPVLPVQAKAVRYFGGANWHTDSVHDIPSVGFVAYLEALQAANGALRVIPGSHRPEFGSAVAHYAKTWGAAVPTEASQEWAAGQPGYAVETTPGDIIVFDEHLYHASVGGHNRRQWRVDYVKDPKGLDEEAKVRAYYAGVFPPDWDGGYDVDRYPHYGERWLTSGQPWVDRLVQLGAYDVAAAEEAYVRSQRK